MLSGRQSLGLTFFVNEGLNLTNKVSKPQQFGPWNSNSPNHKLGQIKSYQLPSHCSIKLPKINRSENLRRYSHSVQLPKSDQVIRFKKYGDRESNISIVNQQKNKQISKFIIHRLQREAHLPAINVKQEYGDIFRNAKLQNSLLQTFQQFRKIRNSFQRRNHIRKLKSIEDKKRQDIYDQIEGLMKKQSPRYNPKFINNNKKVWNSRSKSSKFN